MKRNIGRKEIIRNIAEWRKLEWSRWKGTSRKRKEKRANRIVCSWRIKIIGRAKARRKIIGWSQPRSLRIWIAEDLWGRSKQNIWISRTSVLVTIKSVDQFIIVIFCSLSYNILWIPIFENISKEPIKSNLYLRPLSRIALTHIIKYNHPLFFGSSSLPILHIPLFASCLIPLSSMKRTQKLCGYILMSQVGCIAKLILISKTLLPN